MTISKPALIPYPASIQEHDGEFRLNDEITITPASPSAHALASTLSKRNLRVSVSDMGKGDVVFADAPGDRTAGSYTLDVAKDRITIRGDAPGQFYAVQTLQQLLPRDNGRLIPCMTIEDSPRFGWRGLMLDVSRHFFTKDEVKDFIDLMSMHKLNSFHWHLVDDQGWRIEIKKYPKLTEVGAWREGIGFDLDPKSSSAYDNKGRYGGFYTQDDIREIVAFAKERFITIVPEIEMPGHSGAALSAYPQFSCTGAAQGINTTGGVFSAIYCPGNDDAFEFLQNILAEVFELFPSKFIHIGGDEVPKDAWKKCPKCQQRVKNEKLKNEEELQSYFTRRIEKFINAHDRRLIGWDEILEGGLAPNATVMSWRGVKGGIAAAKSGHDVVMSPTSNCYFDYYQAKDGKGEPKGIGGFLPLETVYAYEPVPDELSADEAKHILGAQGNLWTEFVPNYKHVQYMTYPRACAMAELTWSRKEDRNYEDFRRRLAMHLTRLDARGVNYRKLT